MPFLLCAAANCDCEDFLVPKSRNPKRCTDTNYSHLLGVHHTSRISTQRTQQVEEKSQQEKQIISLDNEKDSDDYVLGYQDMSMVHDQSRKPYDLMVASTNLFTANGCKKLFVD